MPHAERKSVEMLSAFATGRYRYMPLPGASSPVHLGLALPLPDSNLLPPAACFGAGRMPSGRGLCEDAAYVSTLGEAAQLVSACRFGNEETVLARASELSGRIVLPNEILLISGAQFTKRQAWNAAEGGDDWLPEKFDAEKPIDWIEIPDINGTMSALVPAACIYIGWFERGDAGAFCVADTNGTAAGPTWEDATASAFLELVERDATALWWHGCHMRPTVAIGSISGIDEFAKWLASRRRQSHLLDIATDIGIPVFAAVSCEPDGTGVALGFGAAFDATAAAISALTEMIQIESNIELFLGNREAFAGSHLARWYKRVSLESMPFLQPAECPPVETSAFSIKLPIAASEQVNWIANKTNALGLDVYVTDLTRVEIGIPVARVIVPGLRHFKTRLAPGRLYDVPQKLGWCAGVLTPEDMNPVPLAI